MSCYCCRKPRYKRLVDSLFPEDPQSPTPMSANMDKLLFFAQASPDHLDRIGEYLTLRLRRSLQRERNGHVRVALKVTEKLLSDCDARRLQLIADSYLNILHLMLETSSSDFQIMATNSFVKFAERDEGNTPYHRQYDFLIHRFASLSLIKYMDDQTKYYETRMAGLKGLRGVIKKIGRHDSRQINIWDLDHMNKIIPPFLLNMHSHQPRRTESESGDIQALADEGDQTETLGSYSQDSLTELITIAGITHIDSVLKPVLQHFDLNNLWIEDNEFTAGVYISIVNVMQRQDRYKAVQSLVDHLDAKVNDSWEIKQGILDSLSKCVAVAADGSLGPSVLDIFRTLVRHLRISIEGTAAEGPSDLTSSHTFQQSITKTVGEFAGVLPDYHKPDILSLINSYVPVPEQNVDVQGTEHESRSQDHPLAPHANSPMLSSTLVKCLCAVANTYQPSVLETAFPDHLFKSLVQLFLIKDSDTQLDINLLWHRLVDHHGNKENIPLTTVWESLESVGLSLGVVSKRFLSKTGPTLFANLLELAKNLSVRSSNTLAFYQLVFLLTLEFSFQGLNDIISFVGQLQELAVKGREDFAHRRVALHATVAGVLYLTAKISRNETLVAHIDGIVAKRREKAPSLLPDTFFKNVVEEMDGGSSAEGGVATEEIEALQAIVNDESLLFKLSEVELNRQSPAPSGGSSTGPFGRDSVPEMAAHFSVSLDYGPDSPLNTDQITFNNLKEKVELVISDEASGGGAGQGVPSDDLVFDSKEESNPEVSFEAIVGQSSRRDDSTGLMELTAILNTSVPHSSPVSIPGTQDTSNAYDMELPTLH